MVPHLVKRLTQQDLADLVEGAAIFSSGGGGDPQIGSNIVESLREDHCPVRLIDPMEVPDSQIVINFACVGATADAAYHSDAAVKTLRTLEGFLDKKAFAVIAVELGGFNTLAAVDVAARRGIPIVDADGAGRAVPEVHLKVYTLDDIPLAPMVAADINAENIVLIEQTRDSRAAERITRTLATEWNQTVYTARRILTGKQVKTSPVPNTLSMSIRVGTLLRKALDPLGAILKETRGFLLFEGVVTRAEHETKSGFTWTTLGLDGTNESKSSSFELKAKNEFLIAYKDGKLAAIAPDIITAVNPETGRCIPAEKVKKGDKLAVIGIPAPAKWRSKKGLKLWKEVMQRSGITENYAPIERLVKRKSQ
jgi:DUF917 family protein